MAEQRDRVDGDRAVGRERCDQRDVDPAELRGRWPCGQGNRGAPWVGSVFVSEPLQTILVLIAGFFTGLLSGMFGVGGAVVSTPAIRALGASPIEAIGSTLPSIIPSAISGSLRYQRDGLDPLAGGALDRTRRVRRGRGAGALLSDVVPGDGHLLMILTAGAPRAHRVPHRSVAAAARPGRRGEPDPRDGPGLRGRLPPSTRLAGPSADWWRLRHDRARGRAAERACSASAVGS